MPEAPASHASSTRIRTGIAGVSGYAGVELLRLVLGHPWLQLSALGGGRSAGQRVEHIWPALQDSSALPAVQPLDELGPGLDLLFLALPHGVSGPWLAARKELLGSTRVVDLGADFRLRDAAVYARAYGRPHPAPELLQTAVYGLPEVNGSALREARLVANPGCYPTATALAALPLVEAGAAEWIVSSCLSGVSGAGRRAGPRNLYCEVQESAVAYGLAGSHRHTPEIEQTLGQPVTFTPHLVPMVRGMVATVAMKVTENTDLDSIPELYRSRLGHCAAVRLRSTAPATADVRGTGLAHVHVAVDSERRVCTATCVIDNLGKGAAAQAVQNANIMLGLPELTGVPTLPLLP